MTVFKQYLEGLERCDIHHANKAGSVDATVLMPAHIKSKTPLVALHGISRNIHHMTEQLSTAALEFGRVVVLPHFEKKGWKVFQRISNNSRPDSALLGLLSVLRQMDLVDDGAVDLFGFSGGAQLAHRFAMLYPEQVKQLHLGSAGWYTLPDKRLAYPLGLGASHSGDTHWGECMSSGLRRFLNKPISVYVGSADVNVDGALRNTPSVNASQGKNRVERALAYVALLQEMQEEMRLRHRATLEIIKDCGHSFRQCSRKGGLSARVCAA